MKDFLILAILLSASLVNGWKCGEEDKLTEPRSVRPGDKAPPFGGIWVLDGKTEEVNIPKIIDLLLKAKSGVHHSHLLSLRFYLRMPY